MRAPVKRVTKHFRLCRLATEYFDDEMTLFWVALKEIS